MTTLPRVIALGEALVEFMRPTMGIPLGQTGPFEGPFPSGAPANFADACARLSLPTGFIGTVGNDAFGDLFAARLRRDGVDLTHLVVDQERTTGTAFVTYAADGSRDFIFHIAHAAAGQAPTLEPAYFAHAGLVHITGSTLAASARWHTVCVQAVKLAKAAGALVTFDPNLRPELLRGVTLAQLCEPILAHTDVVLPSTAEALALTGERDLPQATTALLRRGVRMVVHKGGAAGSTAISAEGSVHAAAEPRPERDPTGAGDAFAAGVAYGLLLQLPVAEMLRVANHVGGLAVTRLGPMEGTPTLDDVLAALS